MLGKALKSLASRLFKRFCSVPLIKKSFSKGQPSLAIRITEFLGAYLRHFGLQKLGTKELLFIIQC